MDYSGLISQLSVDHPRSVDSICRTLGEPEEDVRAMIRDLVDAGLPVSSRDSGELFLRYPIELLDPRRIRDHLCDRTAQQIAELRVFQQVDSTNSWLLRARRPDSSGMLVCLAERQTHGRGRMGRNWISPIAAGVYLSVCARLEERTPETGALSPMLALNLADELDRFGVHGIRVKWPNDLLWRGRKLGGILMETRIHADAGVSLVAGVGVNYRFPKEWIDHSDRPIADICGIVSPDPCSRNLLAASLIDCISDTIQDGRQCGFRDLPSRWRARDLFLGREIELKRADGRIISGRSMGVDTEGHLILDSAGSVLSFDSGEVSLRGSG